MIIIKVAVVGSRCASSQHYSLILENVPADATEIISGGAVGADMLAKQYAIEKNLRYTEFVPDYKTFSKTAPLIRNNQIVKSADCVICLWDGKSKGTRNVISLCLSLGKPCKVIPM